MSKALKLLVLPDSHANPKVSLRRYHWLGRLILDAKPDVIVDLGDFADNDSLSGYDRGKASFEGRRYAKDVAAAHEARSILDHHIFKLQKRPRLIALCGNHEQRSDRYADDHPEMEGAVSSKDFKPAKWEWFPFLKQVNVGGFVCSHYIVSGVQGRPISGEHPAYSLLKTEFRSCIVGHSHLRDVCERTSGNRRIQCFVAGCYVEPTWRPAYAGPGRDMWWNGILLLDGVSNGQAESWQFIDTRRIMREYAK